MFVGLRIRPFSLLWIVLGQGLFNHSADRLEKSTERLDECKFWTVRLIRVFVGSDRLRRLGGFGREDYIYDSNVIVNKFISVPKDMGGLNCAAFIAGVIKGVLDTADFPATVDAHFPTEDDRSTTIFVIRFEAQVVQRLQKQQ